MSASKVLALTTLFLATMFAETEWKEFTSSEGNFRVVFPETPQQQKGTERNRHRFSAAAGDESYGLTYADYPPGPGLGKRGEQRARFNCERPWRVSGRRETYLGRRLSREMDPFCRTKYEREIAIHFVGHRLYVLHAFAPKGTPRPENFSTFLNSFLLLSKPKA
jgi:hypothetical protein